MNLKNVIAVIKMFLLIFTKVIQDKEQCTKKKQI